MGAGAGVGAGQARGACRDRGAALPWGLGGRQVRGLAGSPRYVCPPTVFSWTPSRGELWQSRSNAAGRAGELLQKPLELVGAAVGRELLLSLGRWQRCGAGTVTRVGLAAAPDCWLLSFLPRSFSCASRATLITGLGCGDRASTCSGWTAAASMTRESHRELGLWGDCPGVGRAGAWWAVSAGTVPCRQPLSPGA